MGRKGGRTPNIITSLELKSEVMEKRNLHLQEKYKKIKDISNKIIFKRHKNKLKIFTVKKNDSENIIYLFMGREFV